MARTGARGEWLDSELLTAIARHDQQACAVFYRRHLSRTVAYLMRETSDPELAADLAAEVFASVIASARRYKPDSETAAPWVIAIARNVLANSRRRGRVQDQVRRRLAIEPLELDDTDLDRTESLAADGTGHAAALVEALPAGERYAVKARVLEERSYGEIAARLRCSEMVVRKRVSRGLARVRQALEERP
jgi:RNA polymerase sigma factor (sigma-70 family)